MDKSAINGAEFDKSEIDLKATDAATTIEKSNAMIDEFMPFINSCAAKYNYSGSSVKHSDIKSIAMEAFYEAIRNYNENRGHFIQFACIVIKSRITDYLRKEYKQRNNVVSMDGMEDSERDSLMLNNSISNYKSNEGNQDLKLEIEQFKNELIDWKLTLEQLIKDSPKHDSLKERYRSITMKILDNQEIIETILCKKYFPVKKVSEITNLPLKKIEHSRTFVLASIIVLKGDYSLIKGFLKL